MKRLDILVLGAALDKLDKDLVINSLAHFLKEIDINSELSINNYLTFEDLVIKSESWELKTNRNYGYLLILGSEATKKANLNPRILDYIVCETIEPKSWSGSLREHIIKQLKGFTTSWYNMESEKKLMACTEKNVYEYQWVKLNIHSFTRFINVLIQNGRPCYILFKDNCLELHDATKRLAEPLKAFVPIVATGDTYEWSQKFKKNFENFAIITPEEFYTHINLMVGHKAGEELQIIVKPFGARTDND